ncbi:unnamed protein product [Candidula unifasciata]|uniref:Uncharacterized protein n=1 Tax=Candidula unifasciata TaxID=100452 RepID=A0A8S3ZB48_9EUPU|nr:unnamed protein product [Candidula unifasciata]
MWTKGEITMWLTKYSLENSSLLYLTGEEIIFLHKLKYEAPEFFYHCLESKLHLESLLDLSRATNALADLTW